MPSKATRTALIAVSALGASGIVATSAHAAAPTIPTSLVNQPAAAGVSNITPESAVVSGVLDTGGNPQSSFQLAPGATLTWDNSFNLVNSGSSAVTEFVDGLPINDGTSTTSGYATNQSTTTLYNQGADNYSTVLFEYDPLTDYVKNGNNPGPLTGYGTEINVPTAPGLSSVSEEIGGYPAANATGISGALTPNTKYVYFFVQQAGATDSAETINTYNGSATGTNPTYSCFPDNYVSAVAPYNTYTSTGTISGGLNTSGTAQTTPQPQIQGPCVYYYGGSANYYNSTPGTFTTPKLGAVTFSAAKVTATVKTVKKVTTKGKTKTTKITKVISGIKASLTALDNSVEGTKGSVELDYAGKKVASANYTVSSFASKTLTLSLTTYGKSLIAKGKAFSTKVVYTTTTDQPTTTKTVRFGAAS